MQNKMGKGRLRASGIRRGFGFQCDIWEFPPQMRTLHVVNQMYRLSMPYTVFVVSYALERKRYRYRLLNVFFASEPLRRRSDVVYESPMSKLDGEVCLGSDDNRNTWTAAGDPYVLCRNVISRYWESEFTDYYRKYLYCRDGPTLHGLSGWRNASAVDPDVGMKIRWDAMGSHCIDEVIDIDGRIRPLPRSEYEKPTQADTETSDAGAVSHVHIQTRRESGGADPEPAGADPGVSFKRYSTHLSRPPVEEPTVTVKTGVRMPWREGLPTPDMASTGTYIRAHRRGTRPSDGGSGVHAPAISPVTSQEGINNLLLSRQLIRLILVMTYQLAELAKTLGDEQGRALVKDVDEKIQVLSSRLTKAIPLVQVVSELPA